MNEDPNVVTHAWRGPLKRVLKMIEHARGEKKKKRFGIPSSTLINTRQSKKCRGKIRSRTNSRRVLDDYDISFPRRSKGKSRWCNLLRAPNDLAICRRCARLLVRVKVYFARILQLTNRLYGNFSRSPFRFFFFLRSYRRQDINWFILRSDHGKKKKKYVIRETHKLWEPAYRKSLLIFSHQFLFFNKNRAENSKLSITSDETDVEIIKF